MLPKVPSEGAYTSWLANCLQSYFEAAGFSFFHEIQSQPREADFPFDICAKIEKGNVVKRFGLQVKRPHESKGGVYWNLDLVQHNNMNKFPWIWYAFPDFLDRKYYRVACFHTLFTNSSFPHVSSLHKSKLRFYYRLGSFADRVIACTIGQKLEKSSDWSSSESVFGEFHFDNQIHTYLDFTEMKAKLVTKISNEENVQNET